MFKKRISLEIKNNSSQHLKILFTNNDNNIVINFVNNPLLYLTIPGDYPFKSPKISIPNNFNQTKDYNRWCADLTSLINRQTHLTSSDILLAWFFVYIKWANYISYPSNKPLYTFPLQCLCCSSLSCSGNWCPARKIIDIANEYILNKTFKIFISPLFLKMIKNILNNDRWQIPDDIIYKILEFI